MFRRYRRANFRQAFKNTGYLFKNSFAVLGNNREIWKPTLRVVALTLVIRIVMLAAIFNLLVQSQHVFGSIIALLFVVFILTPFKFFYVMRQQAKQCWISYNHLLQRPVNYTEASHYVKTFKWRLRLLAVVNYFARRRGVVSSTLVEFFIDFLQEVWDLAEHYLLPVVVIENKGLKEAVMDIAALRNHIPESLVGVFGIDFIGDVVGLVLLPMLVISILLGIVVGHLTLGMLPEQMIFHINGYAFGWLPVYLFFGFGLLFSGVVKDLINTLKTIYFTIFYTSINHPDAMSEQAKQASTAFLQGAR